jgi:hypothetical protein
MKRFLKGIRSIRLPMTGLVAWVTLIAFAMGIGYEYGWPRAVWLSALVALIDLHWPTPKGGAA